MGAANHFRRNHLPINHSLSLVNLLIVAFAFANNFGLLQESVDNFVHLFLVSN